MAVVDNETLRIFNETDLWVPRKKLTALYNELLGNAHSLTIVITDDTHTRTLNRIHRKHNTPANILTFPGDDEMPAEIYMSADRIQHLAEQTGESITNQILFLTTHGMLHLLGHQHGKRMEQLEDLYAKKYMSS